MNIKAKKIISALCVIAMLFSFSVSAFAAQADLKSCNNGYVDAKYNGDINNVKYVTSVGNQGDENECMFYAVTSAAGSYCLRNNIASGTKADFSPASLVKKVGKSTNYGKVLYGCATTALGSGCYITGVENLTDKGVITLKQQIKAKGSVIAAVNLPTGGMADTDYYSSSKATYNYNFSEKFSDTYHAFVIVGWDDDFSKDNFNIKPTENGAWLCKNSYGTDYGKGGYFWLPYSYPITYSASVEVSKFDGIVMLKNPSDSVKLGYVAAVSFISSESTANAQVSILSGNNTVADKKTDVKNGLNFIAFDNPVKANSFTVKINGKAVTALAKYVVLGKSKTLTASAVDVVSEVKTLENVSVNIGETYAYADTSNLTHSIYYNAIDNCYYIAPCDGFAFTGETLINLTQTKVIFENKEQISSIGTASAIDNVTLLPDGCLAVKSKTPGGAYISGLDIVTGEKGQVSDVYLVFDGGQRQLLDTADYTVKLYTDNTKTTPVTDTSDLDFYYAEVTVNGYISSDSFNIYVNGVLASGTSTVSDIGITVDTEIDIPDIATSIIQGLIMIIDFFMNIFGGLR